VWIYKRALAKEKKTLVHMDANSFYGSNWASFCLTELKEWSESISGNQGEYSISSFYCFIGSIHSFYWCLLKDHTKKEKEKRLDDDDDEMMKKNVNVEEKEWPRICNDEEGKQYRFISLKNTPYFAAAQCLAYEPMAIVREEKKDVPAGSTPSATAAASVVAPAQDQRSATPWKTLLTKNRRFNLDLIPQLVLTRGEFADVFVRAGLQQYIFFQRADNIFLMNDESKNNFAQVPLSKASIFQSSLLGMAEKRVLMKLIQISLAVHPLIDHRREDVIEHVSLDEDEKTLLSEFAQRPFAEYLSQWKTSAKLV